MTIPFHALLKLTFFLVLLPFLATFLHLRLVTYRTNVVFVGPVDVLPNRKIKNHMNVDAFYGVWQGFTTDDKQFFFKVTRRSNMEHLWWGWPCITRVSKLLKDSVSMDATMAVQPLLRYNSIDKRWCLSNGDLIVCSTAIAGSGDALSPPSGIWAKDAMSNLSIRLSHYGPRENLNVRNKKTRKNQNLEQVITRPATTLLMAINIALAYLYWNRRTNPADVSKVYSKIVYDHELWRSFTGATAHFEALHLGFNMMALYSLGTELEGGFGSIPFLFYNISLIPITTIIMMVTIYFQIKVTGNAALAETSTVGYSGVLFAWMVVASLEQPQTCPIPFFENICFKTHDFMGFKWNVAPIVQLVVAQFIMRRVSFLGHFAGIVAGFLLHWHVLPLDVVQPCVLIPLLYFIHLWCVSGYIPIGGTMADPETEFLDAQQGGPRFDARRHKRERDQSMKRLMSWMTCVMILFVVTLGMMMDITMVVIFALQTALFNFCRQAHARLIATSTNSTDLARETQRLEALWKVYILATILAVVTNSMTLASWYITGDYWHGTNVVVSYLLASIMLCTTIIVQILGLTLACKSLDGIGQCGSGVFFQTFRFAVLDNAIVVGTSIVPFLTKTTNWTAFEGQGVILGTKPSSRSESDEQVSDVL